jgi:hypothetical protein
MPYSTSTQHSEHCVTLVEVIEKLKTCDEVQILELLDIDSTLLVNAFLDTVEEKVDYLIKELSLGEQVIEH